MRLYKAALSAALYYAEASVVCGIVNWLETPYLNSIRTEQAVQAVFRERLKDQVDFQSRGKKVYSFCIENVLSIPVVRIVVFFVLSLFSSRKDLLWSKKEIVPLLRRLELEMDCPEGITWKPSIYVRKTPSLSTSLVALSRFTRDLTLEVERGEQRPFSGRKKEIGQIAEILMRDQKSNPLLIGPPGVGKTAFARGLAELIVKDEENLPRVFKGKRVFLLEWDRLSMGAERFSADSIKKRLIDIVAEASRNKDSVILFIDEIHAFLRKEGDEVVSILKPALADGTLSCIGATTLRDYQNMIQKDPSLERRFPQVYIHEPSEEDLPQVLHTIVPGLEAHHSVRISDRAIEACIKLGKRFLQSKCFPDKAIDLLDQAAVRVGINQSLGIKDKQLSVFLKLLIRMKNQVTDSSELDQKISQTREKFSRVVSEELIYDLVAETVGLPLQKLQESERDLLNNLEKLLSAKIIGQENSIRSLCQAVRRGRLRLGSEERPAGVFLMLGPTGVGKTASAIALSEILYGSKNNFLRLDMTEYKAPSDINKLIGAPPGYLGHGAGGMLTNWLKKKPFSIVLFDEVEKADSSVFDLLLQVFDAGRITDGNNETVFCLDTIFIMTSNIGAQIILKNNKKQGRQEILAALEESIQRVFRSEFINRMQEVIIFDPLSEVEIAEVAKLQCQALQERVQKNISCPNLKMTWDPTVIQFLVATGYNPAKGAREISRCITRTMENLIGDLIVQEKIMPGAQIHFKSDGKTIELLIK